MIVPKSTEPSASDMMSKSVSWRPCIGCGSMCQMSSLVHVWECWNCQRECSEGETMGDREVSDDVA